MPALKTTVTEVVTGLGTLGLESVDEALRVRPAEMTSLAPEDWDLLNRALTGGALAEEFRLAWSNGQAFLHAADALRGRRPAIVEWKGSHRAPGDEVVPADLRIDHVFFVSCKYLSKIMINASPAHLFERLLQGSHGQRTTNWFTETAPDRYQTLYSVVRAQLRDTAEGSEHGIDLPCDVNTLGADHRRWLAEQLRVRWPGDARARYLELSEIVATESARRWQRALGAAGDAERMLWRILRIGSAPYFVLGSSAAGTLRLRVATPWDWRLHYRLRDFACHPEAKGQPRIAWSAHVQDRHSAASQQITGHVEIRWSHGRFGGNPEAKVYLDTPHRFVPGYFPL